MSKIPAQLRASICALLVLSGLGGGSYYVDQAATAEAQQNQYIQAVAADLDMPDGMRIAMVMAAFYESSNRHIGTPYVDKLGKGQPLTVCNGLTGKDVVAGKWYSPAECFRLEKKRYVQYEQIAKRSLTYWGSYNPFQQATFYDFLHNKGDGNFQTSTMKRDANAGNWVKACRENVRWNKGTVNGVSTVLPGLKIRSDANAELCEWGLSWRG